MLDGMGGRVVQGSVPVTSWYKVLGSISGSGLGSSEDTSVRLNGDCKRACVCVCVCVSE